MLHVDEQPETLHIYVVREEAPKPSLLPIFLSIVALASLVALSGLSSYQQAVTRITLHVPAVLLPLKTFTAQVAIIPTGVKVYPATVTAHALIGGKQGNIPAYVINQVEGSSVYIRNLVAFYGGRDSYSIKIVTAKDRQIALEQARQLLTHESAGLHYPCKESVSHRAYQHVMWSCQFVTYKIPPFMSVAGVSLQGKNLLIHVWFVAHPTHIWVK